MPQQIGQLRKKASEINKKDNVYYKLTFKPKTEPEFSISTYHDSHNMLDQLKWYSVTYEVNGNFKNVKGEGDIKAVEEPTGNAPGRQNGDSSQQSSPYRQPVHPREQRSIQASVALAQTVELMKAGIIDLQDLEFQGERMYRFLTTVGAPTNTHKAGAESNNAQGNGHSADGDIHRTQKTSERPSESLVDPWQAFGGEIKEMGMTPEDVDIMLGKSLEEFKKISGATPAVAIKRIEDYIAKHPTVG